MNQMTWILNDPTGNSIFSNIGNEESQPFGSGSPANVVLIRSITGDTVTYMDMNGRERFVTLGSGSVEVQANRLYHVDVSGGKGVFTCCERSYTARDYDLIANPLLSVSGKTLTFGVGESEKVCYVTGSTKVYYATVKNSRMTLVEGKDFTAAKPTAACQSKGQHTHDANCYAYNAVFACDGQANIRWIIISPDGTSVFGAIGTEKAASSGTSSSSGSSSSVKTAIDPGKVFLTTSAVRTAGESITVTGITMDGVRHTWTVDQSGMIPVLGSLYHVDSVTGDTAKLAGPSVGSGTGASKNYDYMRHPLKSYDAAQKTITLPNGSVYTLTDKTKIYNVDGAMNLLDTHDIIPSKLSDESTCTKHGDKPHGSVNDCYTWSMFYALEGNTVKWILMAPADSSIYSAAGKDAFATYNSASPAQVALSTDRCYPVWDSENDLHYQVDAYLDMSGAVHTGPFTLTPESVKPVIGKYYWAAEGENGVVTFRYIESREAPSSLTERGYAMCRAQLVAYYQTSGIAQLRTGKMIRITEDTVLYTGTYSANGKLSVATSTDVALSRLNPGNCPGETHSHTAECYYWSVAYAADEKGNVKWMVCEKDSKSIWGVLGTAAYRDMGPTSDIGLVLTTGKITQKDGKNVVSVEDVYGTRYTDLVIDNTGIIPQEGYGYWATVNSGSGTVKFKSGTSGAYREKIVSVSDDGILTTNNGARWLYADTLVRYVKVSGGKVAFVDGAGMPAAKNGSNAWLGLVSEKNVKWAVVEVNGEGLYSKLGVECTHTKATVTDLAPTCTISGTGRMACGKCGYVWPAEITIPALGHSWNGGEVTTPASCTDAGVTTYTCTREGCGVTRNEPIEALGHGYQWVVGTPTSCTVPGEQHEWCSRCGGTRNSTVIPATGHTWDGGVTVGDETTYTCTVCGATSIVSTNGPENIAVTTTHTYPVWEGGVKVNKVRYTDMTGVSREAVVSGTLLPVSGKLYKVASMTDGVQFMAASATDLAIRSGTYDADTGSVGAYDVASGSDIFDSAAAVSAGRIDGALSNDTAASGDCLYGVDYEGHVTWLLSGDNLTDARALGTETDMTAVSAAGYAVVTDMRLNDAKDGYDVTFADFAGEGATQTKRLSGSFYPKADYAYAYTLVGDDAVSFAVMPATGYQRDQIKTDYATGLLAGTNSQKLTYKVGADTKILFVKTDSTKKQVQLSTDWTDGLVPAANGYTYWIAPDENGFAKWIVMETTGLSIYGAVGNTGYTASNAAELPANLALVNNGVYRDAQGAYRVNITTMAGSTETVTLDTAGEVPITGSLYAIERTAGGVKFSWAKSNSYKNAFKADAATVQIARGQIRSAAEDGTVKILDASGAEAALTLNSRATVVTASRKSSTAALMQGCNTGYTVPSATNWNAWLGFDVTGSVSWMLVSSDGSSVYYVGDRWKSDTHSDANLKSAPALPTGYIITTSTQRQQGSGYCLNAQDVGGAVYYDLPLSTAYTGTYLTTNTGACFKAAFDANGTATLSKSGAKLGKLLSFTPGVSFVSKDGSGNHTIAYDAGTIVRSVTRSGSNIAINATGGLTVPTSETYNLWYVMDGERCQWVVCGTSTDSTYNYGSPAVN